MLRVILTYVDLKKSCVKALLMQLNLFLSFRVIRDIHKNIAKKVIALIETVT
jgi:hypothetical protein